MNVALWIASGLLAFAMFVAGSVKLFVPRTKLLDKMKWAASFGDGAFKLLGLAEVLGGIGLVVPHATGILPMLTPIAAVCVVVLMAGAVKTHVQLKDQSPAAAAVLALVGVFVAVGRFGVL